MRKLFVLFLLCVVAVPMRAQVQPSSEGQRRAAQTEARQEISAVKNTLHEEAQRRQEEFRAMMDAQRGVLKDTIKAKREELRQRLTAISDEQKRKRVETIDARMDALNERMTEHFSLALEQLENILEKIAERAGEVAEKGDTGAAVSVAMTSAKTSLAISRTATVLQAGKTYTVMISAEDALRTDVGIARQALHDDLVMVRETVKNARDAVHDAAIALAQDVNTKEGTTATSSPALQTAQ